jgi:translation initiation factor IF-3
LEKPPFNNQIREEKVRVIDETGKNLGILDLKEALQIAKERNLDLIQVTEKVTPPVCKIGDYGKYLYWLQKKKKGKKEKGELKGIRLGFNISEHDLEIKAQQAEKFLKKGNKIRLEIILRGREKSLENFAREKINHFLKTLGQSMPIKVERELKKEARGLTMIISKG